MRAHGCARAPYGEGEPRKAEHCLQRDPRHPGRHNARPARGDQLGIELFINLRRVQILPRSIKLHRRAERAQRRRKNLRAAHAPCLLRLRHKVGKHLLRPAVIHPAEVRAVQKAAKIGDAQLLHARNIGPALLRPREVLHHLHIVAVIRAVTARKVEKQPADVRQFPPAPAVPCEPALKMRVVKQQIPDPPEAEFLFQHCATSPLSSIRLSACRRFASAHAVFAAPRAQPRGPRA